MNSKWSVDKIKTMKKIFGYTIIGLLIAGYVTMNCIIHGTGVFMLALGLTAAIMCLLWFAIYLIDK